MGIANELAEGVVEVLNELGKSITLRKINPGAYDPATGTATPTTVDTVCRGVAINYSDILVNGTSIIAGDRQCYISAVSLGAVKPTVGDYIILADGTFVILDPGRVELQDTSVVWKCQIRRGT